MSQGENNCHVHFVKEKTIVTCNWIDFWELLQLFSVRDFSKSHDSLRNGQNFRPPASRLSELSDLKAVAQYVLLNSLYGIPDIRECATGSYVSHFSFHPFPLLSPGVSFSVTRSAANNALGKKYRPWYFSNARGLDPPPSFPDNGNDARGSRGDLDYHLARNVQFII